MTSKIYLRNLTGFRFLAALMVIICHLELFKSREGLPHMWSHPLVSEAGSAGVDFFFVLSGFLITVLLLAEKDRFATINLKKFYLRRILRIWPLYYLVLLLSFCVVPFINAFTIDGYSDGLWLNYWSKFLLSLMFMPNVALSFFQHIPYAAPLWSVGVEEQFYLVWPLIVLVFTRQLKPISFFILGFIALKGLLLVAGKANLFDADQFARVKNFVVATRMECMGIGGLGGYLYYTHSKIWKWLSGNLLATASIIVTPVVFFVVGYLFEMHHIVFSILFLIIILNGATNKNTFINLEGKLFYTLGTISFGLYLWHSFAIGFTLWVMRQTDLWSSSSAIANTIYYSMSFLLTAGISYISYHYFEKLFLRIKKKHTLIVSGDDARQPQSSHPVGVKLPVRREKEEISAL